VPRSRIFEQIIDVLVPRVMETVFGVRTNMPQEPVDLRTVEQIVASNHGGTREKIQTTEVETLKIIQKSVQRKNIQEKVISLPKIIGELLALQKLVQKPLGVRLVQVVDKILKVPVTK